MFCLYFYVHLQQIDFFSLPQFKRQPRLTLACTNMAAARQFYRHQAQMWSVRVILNTQSEHFHILRDLAVLLEPAHKGLTKTDITPSLLHIR